MSLVVITHLLTPKHCTTWFGSYHIHFTTLTDVNDPFCHENTPSEALRYLIWFSLSLSCMCPFSTSKLRNVLLISLQPWFCTGTHCGSHLTLLEISSIYSKAPVTLSTHLCIISTSISLSQTPFTSKHFLLLGNSTISSNIHIRIDFILKQSPGVKSGTYRDSGSCLAWCWSWFSPSTAESPLGNPQKNHAKYQSTTGCSSPSLQYFSKQKCALNLLFLSF